MVQVEPENVLSFLGVVIAAWLSYASARVAARAKVQTVTQEKEDGKIQAAVDRVLDVMEEGSPRGTGRSAGWTAGVGA